MFSCGFCTDGKPPRGRRSPATAWSPSPDLGICIDVAKFHGLVHQLLDTYERDVGALRRELDQRKGIVSWHDGFSTDSEDEDRTRSSCSPSAPGPSAPSPPDPGREGASQKYCVELMPTSHETTAEPGELQGLASESLGRPSQEMSVVPSARPSFVRSRSTTLGGNLKIGDEEVPVAERVVLRPLEHVIGFLIVLNVLLIFVHLELRGAVLGTWLETQGDGLFEQHSDDAAERVFFACEHVFNGIFVLELVLRMALLGRGFFRAAEDLTVKWFNIFDASIVVFCSFDLYLSPIMAGLGSPVNLTSARILRLVRMARALKVLQVLKAFSKLQILVRTVAASILSFAWSMAFLGLMTLAGAIFICEMLQPAIADEALDYDLRLWLNRMYGTSAKSIWTMFEFTFSGGWPNYARPVVEGVHWAYSIFFAAYTSVVVFAAIRIVTALFLKDTLSVAGRDSELLVQESMKKNRDYAMRLKELFTLADTSGNGSLDIDELQGFCSIPEVRHYFKVLDMEISEVNALFELLDDGDGQVTHEEFVEGIVRLKGTARAMDLLTVMRCSERIEAKCRKLEAMVGDLRGAGRPESHASTSGIRLQL